MESGFSRFWGNLCHPFRKMLGTGSPDESTLLKRQVAELEGTLSALKQRLESVDKNQR